MNVLITAGGTSEKIDQVRSITNHSTGRLGKTVAEAFLALPSVSIDYVTTNIAVKPEANELISFHLIESTQDLFDTLKKLLMHKTYDVIIHSMAVSDFTPSFSLSEEELAKSIERVPLAPENLLDWFTENEKFSDKCDKEEKISSDKKISSNTEHLVIVLKKTPKIISYLREWQPQAKIIGFKLLVDVPKEHLLAVAKKSLQTNQADFILANDLTQIDDQNHHGYLLSAAGEIREAYTKQDIAEIIVEAVESPHHFE